MTEAPLVGGAGSLDCLDLALGLSGKCDDFPLQVTWVLPYGSAVPASERILATPGRLKQVLLARTPLAGSAAESDVIDGLVDHEQEHAAAAAVVGFRAVRYFLRVRARAERHRLQIGVLLGHPDGTVTKLGYAAVQAAPLRPSLADLHMLKVMGYADADDLAERVIVHNSRPGVRPLPVPPSYWV